MSPTIGSAGFAPLLPVGKQYLSVLQLRHLCVDPFPLSTTRDMIMRGLEAIVGTLRAANVQGEIWVDGSFLTEKIDPNDSDAVLFVESAFYDGADAHQKDAVGWVNGNLKAPHLCDSYVSVVYPVSHQLYWYGEYMRAYWMRQWGFSANLATMKGIAVVTL